MKKYPDKKKMKIRVTNKMLDDEKAELQNELKSTKLELQEHMTLLMK